MTSQHAARDRRDEREVRTAMARGSNAVDGEVLVETERGMVGRGNPV